MTIYSGWNDRDGDGVAAAEVPKQYIINAKIFMVGLPGLQSLLKRGRLSNHAYGLRADLVCLNIDPAEVRRMS